MKNRQPNIFWFRQDLRINDNPALADAASDAPIIPIYILDDDNAGEWASGSASRWWLHHSLVSLNNSLSGKLCCLRGKADDLLPRLAKRTDAAAVYWNRCYEPWRVARDGKISGKLEKLDCEVVTHNGSLLFDPLEVSKADGTPYKVFTPYYRKGCLANAAEPRLPIKSPDLELADCGDGCLTVAQLQLLPAIRWYDGIAATWSPGERGASERLEEFLDAGLKNYRKGRDRPDQAHVSRLSPHLHFGEISPNQVLHAVKTKSALAGMENDVEHFLSELGWREFSYYLLKHWPTMPQSNLQPKFDRFPWRDDSSALDCWQRGQTGYPIVDAGMRELWQTGYMHNRVRMVVASFLVKNLMLHWRHGARWFWDTLVDADLANNSAGWQWVAGSGADAAPYFRIFNPVTQGQKFDPDGEYVRRYVPEIAELPNRFLHSPWQAPEDVLEAANIRLGKNYPLPVVDLKVSRERALEAFKSLSG